MPLTAFSYRTGSHRCLGGIFPLPGASSFLVSPAPSESYFFLRDFLSYHEPHYGPFSFLVHFPFLGPFTFPLNFLLPFLLSPKCTPPPPPPPQNMWNPPCLLSRYQYHFTPLAPLYTFFFLSLPPFFLKGALHLDSVYKAYFLIFSHDA